MIIARTATHLASELDALRFRNGAQRCVSLVTTRGGFHDGHGRVINAAATVSDIVVVAVAPEPNQKNGNVVTVSEFKDISFLENHSVDLLYAPAEDDLFPHSFEFMISVTQPHACDIVDVGSYRLTQHLKIINTVRPNIMVWGEKNFVEFHSVRQMINNLDIRTQIQCVPTLRHADGVAISSAAERMTTAERANLPILYETLNNVAHAIRTGARTFSKLEKTARLALRGAGLQIQYFKILDEDNLGAATEKTTTYRILGGVKLGDVPVSDSIGLTL
ncbi:MAG: pantoate--beta-alanine ligase [bacterium]